MATTMGNPFPVSATNTQMRFSHQLAIMLKRLEIGSRSKVINFSIIQSFSDPKDKRLDTSVFTETNPGISAGRDGEDKIGLGQAWVYLHL